MQEAGRSELEEVLHSKSGSLKPGGEDSPSSGEMTRVDQLLHEARKLPRGERDAFLRFACKKDTEILREVQSLLNVADGMGEEFLEESVLPCKVHPEEVCDGTLVGNYRILREIGRGGMGRVYLATRDDEVYQQEVAVKILKRDLEKGEFVHRFHNERRLLARLEHPHIVRILDGGTTEGGRPYLVTEYVDGEPIHRYLEKYDLSLWARLELFRKVCAAVSFAHQNLVVHRDLKPQNILIDHRGDPKLLDFGIAKLLESGEESLTLVGLQPLTPRYASPEQVTSNSITTASDVYSLGSLLYEVLTGTALYENVPVGERLFRKILEEEPQPPSRAPNSRHLTGDLDSIVLKALEKEPHRRYSSVEQLSEDIGRYLAGMPVRARQGTALYRSGKFVRRHRVEVVSTFLILLGILCFSFWMKVLRDRAVEAQEKATRSEVRAILEGQRAQEVTEFMIEVFQVPNPEISQGKELSARQLLDQSVRTIEAKLHDQPMLRAELLSAMGRAYLGLGIFGQAGEFLEESLELRLESPDSEPEDLVASLFHLAEQRKAIDRLEEAVQLSDEALKILRQVSGDSSSLARSLNNQAILLKRQGDFRIAEERYREVLAMTIRLAGEEHEDVARFKHNLATVLRGQGKYEESEKLYLESLEFKTEHFGEDSLEAAMTRKGFALLLMERGDLEGAERVLQEVLSVRVRVFGEMDPRVGTVHYDLGRVFRLRGQVESADLLFQKASEIFTLSLGGDHSKVALVLREQALIRLAQRREEEALETAQQALDIFQDAKVRGEIAEAESVLGACFLALGRIEDSGPLLNRGYEHLKANRGPKSRQTLEALDRLQWLRETNP